MSITVATLHDCLAKTFAVDAQQHTDDLLVLFLQHQNYRTSLSVELFAYRVVDDTEPHYGVKLWGSFIDEDDNPLDFGHYSEAQIDQLCRQLSDEIAWCRLRPQAMDPAGTTVELYRATHIPRDDPDDLPLVLQEGINDLLCEWLTLFPVLQAVATDTLEDFSHLGQLLQPSGSRQ